MIIKCTSIEVAFSNAGPLDGSYILDENSGWCIQDDQGEYTIIAKPDDLLAIEVIDRYGKTARFHVNDEGMQSVAIQIDEGHQFELNQATIQVSYLELSPSDSFDSSDYSDIYYSDECEDCPGLHSNTSLYKHTHDRKGIEELEQGWLKKIWNFFYLIILILFWVPFVESKWSDYMRNIIRVLLVMVFLLPTVLLICKPETYTPLAAFLVSCLFFGLARWCGYEEAEQRGKENANDRWMPGAESAIYRLMTVSDSLRYFRSDLSATCNSAKNDIPELTQEENSANRIYWRIQCQNGSRRLGDIVNHVEDALSDWIRFVMSNCQGDECQRINQAMLQHKTQRALQQRGECGNSACTLHPDYNKERPSQSDS